MLRDRSFVHPLGVDPARGRVARDLARGGEVEGWNVAFEWWVWNEVCVRRYGWPPLAQEQTYDAMAKARAFALPGSLGNVSDVLALSRKKDPDGDRLLKKFSMPRNPTKAERRLPQSWLTRRRYHAT